MIQQFVKLIPESHKYFDTNGKQYTSVSKVLDSLEEPFDVEMISRNCAGKAKYAGMNQQQVKDQWKATSKIATDYGTRVHESLERYTKEFKILDTDKDLSNIIKEICSDYIEYKRTYDEICLYHPDYGVAGTADKFLLIKSRSGIADIEDYKSNRGGIHFHNEYNKYMKFPVEHLQQCSYNRYALQESLYGVMYEKLTGNKIRKCWIRHIKEIKDKDDNVIGYKQERIPLPYLRTDAVNILEHFYNSNNISILANADLNDVPTFD